MKSIGQVVSQENTFDECVCVLFFPYMSLCKPNDPWGGSIFYARAII